MFVFLPKFGFSIRTIARDDHLPLIKVILLDTVLHIAFRWPEVMELLALTYTVQLAWH